MQAANECCFGSVCVATLQRYRQEHKCEGARCGIFGVKDTENGETGYCCIMGAAGEHYAFGLYLGSEDLQKIKALGLKFRGGNAWPLFRNHTPWFVPWYLESAQVRFLTTALQQAINVSTWFKKDKSLLEHPSKAHYFVRVPRTQGENTIWQDEWLVPLPPEKGERPCYPLMSLMVDHHSAFIFNFQLEKRAAVLMDFPAKFIEFLEKTKLMPERLLVKRDEVSRILEPLAAKLGIAISSVESLPALEYAERSMRGVV